MSNKQLAIDENLHRELKLKSVTSGTIKSWAEKFIQLGLKIESLSPNVKIKVYDFIENSDVKK
jgi:hypothetical protein